MKKTVNIDWDGVVTGSRWADASASAAEKIYLLDAGSLNREGWHFYHKWTDGAAFDSKAEAYVAYREAADWLYSRPDRDWSQPTLEAKETIGGMVMSGLRVRIVTAPFRPKPWSDVTFRLREANAWFPTCDVCIVRTAATKKYYNADVIVDDSPFVEDWAQEGALNILFGENEYADVPQADTPAVVRARSWQEVKRLLIEERMVERWYDVEHCRV